MTSTPRARTEKSDKQLRAIIDAATRLFAQRGYTATSLRDVAEAVGLLKGSLYYYVESKENLLYAVLHGAHQEMLTGLRAWSATDWGGPMQRIEAFIVQHLAGTFRSINASKVFYADFDKLSLDLRREIIRERRQYEDALTKSISEAHEVVPVSVDTRLAAVMILNSLNQVHYWYEAGGRWSPDDVRQTFVRVLCQGLIGRPYEPSISFLSVGGPS